MRTNCSAIPECSLDHISQPLRSSDGGKRAAAIALEFSDFTTRERFRKAKAASAAEKRGDATPFWTARASVSEVQALSNAEK